MSNLSSRTAKVLQQLLPKAAARQPAGAIPDDNINASSAENSLLRSELGKIISEAIEANSSSDVRLPVLCLTWLPSEYLVDSNLSWNPWRIDHHAKCLSQFLQ